MSAQSYFSYPANFLAMVAPRKSMRICHCFYAIVTAGLLMIGLFSAFDANAKRIAGGRSIGRQSHITQQLTQPVKTHTPRLGALLEGAQPSHGQIPPTAAQPKRNWLGPLVGLASGLGLAALLSHFGFSGILASMLNVLLIAVIALVGLWLFRKFSNRNARPITPYAYKGFELSSRTLPHPYNSGVRSPTTGEIGQVSIAPDSQETCISPNLGVLNATTVPAGFDADAFMHQTKIAFVRLQAAWDAGNIADICALTTPEMLAEIKIDLDSRNGENHTDIVHLNADLVSVESRGSNEYVASVRFHGLIREARGAAAEPFVEIWNLSRNVQSGEGWMLAGIQQPSC
ncbi:hypothetical protein GJV44_00799 [Candidatus Vallotia cooleyia]|nr:hypothetical protein GJV44_00799 [Candidatus Vallotia cooleyia]